MCSKSPTGSRKRHKQLLDYPQDWYHRCQDPCFKPATKSASYLLSHSSWLLPRRFPNLSQRDNLRAKEPDLIRKRNMQLISPKHLFGTQTPPSTPQRTQAAQQGGISAPQSCHSSKPHDGVMWHVPSPASLKGRGITNKATVHICIKSQHKHALVTAR